VTEAYCIDYTQLAIGAPEDPVEQAPWLRYQMRLYAMLCLNYPDEELEKMWQLGIVMWPHLCENFPDETPEVLAEMGEACTDWVWFWSPQEAVCWENPERGEVGHREEEDRELLEYPCNCLYCRGETDAPL
jgi:hypothetical protein